MGTAVFLGSQAMGESGCVTAETGMKIMPYALGTDCVAGTGVVAVCVTTKIRELMEADVDDLLNADVGSEE